MLRKFWLASAVGVAGALASCGGGGSVDDGTVKLNATPQEIVFTSPECAGSGELRVMVSGGVEPYSIFNPLPSAIRLSSSFIKEAGDYFTVFVRAGACMDEIPLTITDSDANTVTVTITHVDDPDS